MTAGPGAPPLAAQLDDLLACVHCGFCLAACPTYELLGAENDSPRGRLYLMRAVAEARLSSDDSAFALHLDRCLGCRACEPVCPSGVRYGFLLEHSREARAAAGGAADRLARLGLRLLFSKRRIQSLVWALLRLLRASRLPRLIARAGARDRVPGRLRFAMAMLAATAPARRGVLAKLRGGRNFAQGAPEPDEAGRDAGDESLALLQGCVMAGLFGHVNRASERLVAAAGARPLRLPAGLCCGALHAHAGELEAARLLAREVIQAFEGSGAATLLTNSAGCGAALKEYETWLRDDPEFAGRAQTFSGRVRMVSEWLAGRAGNSYRSLQARVGYDAPCHLLHAQPNVAGPLPLLSRIPGLEVVPLPRSDRCCGAAGVYGLIQRRLADDILRRKLSEVAEVDASVLATGNPGCIMQIGAGALVLRRSLQVVHPLELLDGLAE